MAQKRSWIAGLMLMLAILVIPPLLISGGLVAIIVWNDYNGICPGIMDIPPYECTMWEFAARNSISPFALPVHFLIWIAYEFFAITLMAALFIVRKKSQTSDPAT